jgi:hypothetical protein
MLSVSPEDITLGSLPSQGTGWQLTAVVDPTTGQIGIQIYSPTPITATQAGSLVNIAFHVLPGEPTGVNPRVTSSVQLVNTVTPNGQWFGTSVADAQGAMILSPGVDTVGIISHLSGQERSPDLRLNAVLDRVFAEQDSDDFGELGV